MKTLVTLFSLFFCTSFCFAKSPTLQPNILGQTLLFDDSKSESKLEVSFWVPEEQQGQLPLLVVLDGQRYFAYATSMHHMMQQYGWAPPFAILGINIRKGRWSTYLGQRAELLEILSSQVFPYLDENYNLSHQRILFGWEAAGGLTLRTLVDQPELFDSFIAASPSPLYGDYFPTYEQDYQSMLLALSNKKLNKHLYIAQGKYDYPQYLGIGELVKGLTKHKDSGLRWYFEQINDATHADLGFEALMRGVRNCFYYYDKPEFDSGEDFQSKGGFSYLDKYFAEQASLYGFSEEQVAQNRFEVLRKLSFYFVMDEQVLAFKQFLHALEPSDFLARSHMNHIYSYAKFLLTHKDIEGANVLLSYLAERHPEQARPIYGLGLVAQARQNKQEAHQLMTQAVNLAEQIQDFRLPEYKKSLDTLNQ